MKKITATIISFVALALVVTSCGKKDEVSTSALEKSFQSAEAPTQSSVNDAVAAIKSADYAGALAKLQKVAADAKLTPEQQKAVQDVIAQVKTALTASMNKAGEGASKAVGDLQKSLPK